MSSRHVRITRTTELPSTNYHITKHHYQPIRYRPGVEVIRRPDVEHKIVSAEATAGRQLGGYGGPKAKTTVIQRSSSGLAEPDMGRGGVNVRRTVTSSSTQREQPENFVNMQHSMESELQRRRTDWESEVEKMQHSFFDMKSSDVSKDKLKDSDLQPRTEILSVGDSKTLYHELPDGSRVYRQKFDLHGFDTEDLRVEADGGKLTITASKEEDYGQAKSTRQFNRTVDIPEAVDTDQISSYLGEDGVLVIEAPVDETKLQNHKSYVHKTETTELDAPFETRELAPSFESSYKGAFSPPEYDTVVESRTSRSSGGPSAFSRTRYIGPDVEDTPHGRKLKTSLYVGKKYKPDDITVKLYDYKINVEAKTEEKIAGRTARRQFARDVDIPGPIERATFQAMLGEDGKIYMGGSFEGNENHDLVEESVDGDMPSGGKSVNIMF